MVAIIGKVGSGKSSLLNAIIGDMKKTDGELTIRGSIAYCQQQPWIQNESLRENILFGSEYDSEKYEKVIQACCLKRDLSILPDGDLTEIGEQGINVSGGQKQRLSLARAVYYDADIYLLDDPLSAVDSHVGKHLFEKCIQTCLSEKTRILVTHQLHFISNVDMIIMMDKGSIVCKGTFNELMKSSDRFRELLKTYSSSGDESKNSTIETREVQEAENLVLEKIGIPAGLTNKEEQSTGSIKGRVIWLYTQYAGGLKAVLSIIIWIIFANAVRIVTDQWLVIWLNQRFQLKEHTYIICYVFIAVSQLVFSVVYGFYIAHFLARASKTMHNLAIKSIFKSPVSFFDQNPLGRITSRYFICN